MKEIDSFAHIPSFFSRWDCRIKIISLSLPVTLCAFAGEPITLLLLFIFIILLTLFSHLPGTYLLDGLKLPFFFTLFMTPFLILTAGGRVLFSPGGIDLFREGFFLSFRLGIKSLTMVLLFILMFGTAPFNRSLKALGSLKLPPALVMLLDFTYRFIFYYNEELSRAFKAASLRGLKKQSFFRGLKSRGGLFFSLLIRGYEQSERVYGAMRLRGLKKHYPSIHPFRISPGDIGKGLLIFLITGTLGCLEVLWNRF